MERTAGADSNYWQKIKMGLLRDEPPNKISWQGRPLRPLAKALRYAAPVKQQNGGKNKQSSKCCFV